MPASATADLRPSTATDPSTADPLEVREVRLRDAGDVVPLLDAWEDLAANAAEPNVFYEPTVVVPALEAYRPDLHLVLVSARDSSGPERLLGLFPVERVTFSRRPWIPVPTLRLWSWAHCFLSTPLVREGAVAEVLGAFLRWAEGRRDFGLLELPTVSAAGPVGRALLEELRASGLLFQARRWERALWFPEPEAAGSYVVRSLSGKKRKELRRLRRRLAEEGALDLVELGPASGEPAGCPVLEAWTDDFLVLEESGWKGAHGTALQCDPRDRDFFRRLLAAAHAKGCLEMLALRLDGRPIAMKCNLRAADGAFAFKIAYDEAYARYSPGFLLEIATIENLARRGTTRWLDTCAVPGHPMAESLFTERLVLQNVRVATGPTGHLVLRALSLKRRLLPGSRFRGEAAPTKGDLPMSRVLEIEPDEMIRSFDRRPFLCRHRLTDDRAFEIPSLIDLARQLPGSCVEYQSGEVPIGLDPSVAPRTGLSLEETLENIESCASWVVLKHVEQVPAYRELMARALADVVAAHPGLQPSSLLGPAAFVFVSSAASVTPYHVDPELNFLLQIRGHKVMYVWPASDRDALPEEALERFHAGSHRNLGYRDELQERALRCDLDPGDALHVPVTAPHWVQNGGAVSVSLSVTFRTRESNRREILYRINANLRRLKLRPRPPGASPGSDRLKLAAFEALRRARRVVASTAGRPSPAESPAK